MEKGSSIFIAGHNGLVGSALLRRLQANGYHNFILRSHSELDLTRQDNVNLLFARNNIDYVFLAAAKVGGICANSTQPASFIYSNLQIQLNVLNASWMHGIEKLLFLGSSCIYPKFAAQPIREDALLSGQLEPTNKAYAIAKIAGIEMCKSYNKQFKTNFISVMPTNLYGINDHYNTVMSHVIPSLILKFHEAKICNYKEVVVWGTGKPTREFLFADDLADACIFLMNEYNDSEIINIGYGSEISIAQLAFMIKTIVGFEGDIKFDKTKPDGIYKKLIDSSKIHKLGWRHKTELLEGLKITYEDFKRKECNK